MAQPKVEKKKKKENKRKTKNTHQENPKQIKQVFKVAKCTSIQLKIRKSWEGTFFFFFHFAEDARKSVPLKYNH